MSPEEGTAHILALIRQADTSGYNIVHLGDLRERSHLGREAFDQALQHARGAGKVTLSAAEGRQGLSQRDQDAAVHETDHSTEGGRRQALLYAHVRNA